MIFKRFIGFTFLVIVLISGCKTTSIIQTEPAVLPQEPGRGISNEFRGFLIPVNKSEATYVNIPDDNLKKAVIAASDVNFNAIFIPYQEIVMSADMNIGGSNIESEDPDLLKTLVQMSHQEGLKLYLTIDLLNLLKGRTGGGFDEFLSEEDVPSELRTIYNNYFNLGTDTERIQDVLLSDKIFPYLKSFLKEQLKKITETHDIDGIGYNMTSWASILDNSNSGSGDVDYGNLQNNEDQMSMNGMGSEQDSIAKERLSDLIEDIAVETMLVKPYLVNSIIYPGNFLHDFFIDCLENRTVDFIVPEFKTNDERLVENLSDLWDSGVVDKPLAESVYPCFSIFNRESDDSILHDLLAFNREMESQGIIISMDIQNDFDKSSIDLPGIFNDTLPIPKKLKKSSPSEVSTLNITPLFSGSVQTSIIDVYGRSKRKMMDSNGEISIVLAHPDSIDLEISGRKTILRTSQWSVPYRYTIYNEDQAIREGPWLEFRRMPSSHTNSEVFHLLCKTQYPANAWIDDESVKVYKTGIFFKEISLKEGSNRIRATVLTPDSMSVLYEQEYIYEKIDNSRPVFPLWIDNESVKPSDDLELLPEDVVNLDFIGSRGQTAFVELFPGRDMIKCARNDFEDHSRYTAEISLSMLDIDKEYHFILHIETYVDSVEKKVYKFPMENTITIRSLDQFPMLRIKEENTRLTYNLGPIRLGGPIRSELGRGVLLKANGKIGDNYRIRLDKIENSMVGQDQVEVLANETILPSYYITNISCAPGIGEDIVSIPYPEKVPYAIYPEPDQNRIVITLYGVKTSSTWITHRKGRQVIEKITWQQTTPDTYKVYVNLKTSKIWGYELQPDGRQLVFRIKHPPHYELKNDKPLTGLKIAIEAGHGGESTGAVGLSGLLEKDINLDLALKFGELCKSMGADVFQVRETDMTIGLLDKRKEAVSSDADILISIHANAAGTSRGYLVVPGTSTYYNNPFWAPLAENVYDRLLELGLAEFGVIGSFNYTVIRVSQMPAILVEQAFMTHAEDEEKLADPEFRQKMAVKIYDGIIDYLSYMNDDPD